MKRIEIDDELYAHIASHTQFIGESASDILRRMLNLAPSGARPVDTFDGAVDEPSREQPKPRQQVSTRSVFDVITSADLAGQKGKVGCFLYILSMLYRCHPEQFVKVLTIRGRDRLYFATSERELLSSGNSTNPKEIPESGFWVITNSNTTKKKSMLTRVALELGYSQQDAEQIRDFLS
ncbi:MAG: replication initiation negative regulator SeqA [Idiomarina sp.]|nr:replication initiation negative regulator SeqA [Idiomarina sp.]